jgi:hypothetical protein
MSSSCGSKSVCYGRENPIWSASTSSSSRPTGEYVYVVRRGGTDRTGLLEGSEQARTGHIGKDVEVRNSLVISRATLTESYESS